MGHPTDIFVAEPSAGCICAICHDVLKDASTYIECGHTFCWGCIEDIDANADPDTAPLCPNCRAEVSYDDAIANYVVRDMIGALQVRCTEGNRDGDVGDSNSNKRRRGDDDNDTGDCASKNTGCNWTGPLKDLKGHGDVCDYKIVTCTVDGCDHSCKRKDMNDHLSGAGLLKHLDLMKQSIVAEYEEKLVEKCREVTAGIEGDMTVAMNHMKYAQDCRSWIEHMPDALYNFSVYQLREPHGPIVGLLCIIPGPKGSDWDGARIPMTLRYVVPDKKYFQYGVGRPFRSLIRPPTCKFPGGFFHPNVFPSGTISLSTLVEDANFRGVGWSPEITLPEILFSVQQHLCHPNFSSPAQSAAYNVYTNEGPEQYRIRVKEEAQKYSNYSGHHPEVQKIMSGNEIIDTELLEKTELALGHHQLLMEATPKPPPFQRDAKGKLQKKHGPRGYEDCECSCCAWGQVFWDDQRKMRFLFGTPC